MIAIALFFLLGVPGGKVPRAFKLGSCQPGTNVLQLIVPRGSSFELVLGGPPFSPGFPESLPAGTNAFATITVENADGVVYSRDITHGVVSECNWLEKFGHPRAVILTWPHEDSRLRLEDVLRPGERYTVKFGLQYCSTNQTSLWLHWLGVPRVALR